MAKALIGHMNSDPRTTAHLVSEVARLRARVRDLEDLVTALKSENDLLVAQAADHVEGSLELQTV
ncbi:MAG: hypothetical protein ACSLEW_02775 [Nocardioides sp.]